MLALNLSLTSLGNENTSTSVNNNSIFSNKFKIISLLTFGSMLYYNASKFEITQGLPCISSINCAELLTV